MADRIVALVDMDCFYCQVEARLNPDLEGKPMAVVQYNAWKGGGIIAVNYEARDRGVTRHMRGDEAKQHCPEIELVSVPSVRGKADLTKYRDAGREVVTVLCKFSECVQRASVDEAYIDLTEAVKKRLDNDKDIQSCLLKNTFVVGYSPDDSNEEDERLNGVDSWLDDVYNGDLADPQLHRLATAAALVEEMRLAVYEATGFRCSAGIAHNKILAKLVCGLHKPNRQTLLPKSSVPELYQTLPVKKVRNLGGKLGDDVVDRLGITVMADLAAFSERDLQTRYDEKTGTWLYNIARGIDLEPVTPRLVSKSIGCCKKFPGRSALATKKHVDHWLTELAAEVAERLEEDFSMNKRRAHLLTVSFQQDVSGRSVSMSRSGPCSSYEPDKIVAAALSLLQKSNTAPPSSELWTPPIKFLGISAGKFSEIGGSLSTMSINNFFKPTAEPPGFDTPNKEDKAACTVVKDLPATSKEEENKTTGSFFERYFRNKSKKLPESEITKRNCMYFEPSLGKNSNDNEKKLCALNEERLENNNKAKKQNKNYETELLFEDVDIITNLDNELKHDCVPSSSKDQTTRMNVAKSDSCNDGSTDYSPLSTGNNDNVDTWVSPSEIFPDMNNIDDNVMQLLPSPMQRKITSVRKNKTYENSNSIGEISPLKSDSADNDELLNIGGRQVHDRSRFSLMSSASSECAPTILETVACVHNSDIKDVNHKNYNNLKFNFHHENKPATSFDTSSIDIFMDEKDEPEIPSISEECPHCKQTVLLQDFPEHLDHHIAMDLHNQLNSVQPQSKPVNRNTVSNNKKRGRANKKEAPIPHKKTRTIASFFTRR